VQQPRATTTTSAKNPVAYAFSLIGSSKHTKRQYPKRLKLFFDYIGVQSTDLEQQGLVFLEQARKEGHEWVTQNLMTYLDHHKERVSNNEIAPGTLKNLYRPIKGFLDAYPDISAFIPWRRIARTLPKVKLYSNDRAPTLEELRQLVGFFDHRIKPIVYVMASSGIRVGAWDWLKWKHVTPITKQNEKTGEQQEIIAARLLVYAGTGEEYVTFMTVEAYNSLKDWMDFRARYGEKITGESWLMRNIWRTIDAKRKQGISIHKKKNNNYDFGGNSSGGESFGYRVKGEATEPIKLPSEAIKHILLRALYVQGIRSELPDGDKRHPFKTAHSLRKYFKTRAEYAGMNRTNVEVLMGHSLGISSSYYKPSEQELLTDYLKAVPALTISEDITNIKKQQEILEQKDKKQEKDIEALKEKYESTKEGYSFFFEKSQIYTEMVEQQKAAIARMVEDQKTEITSLKEMMKKLEEKLEKQKSAAGEKT
jgi:integrase